MADNRDPLQVAYMAGAKRMLELLGETVDKLDAMAIAAEGADPRMGPGPLEGASCLALNRYVRVILRGGEAGIASMERDRG